MAGPVTRRNMPSCAERAQSPDHGILREHIFQQFSVDGKIGGYLDYLWEKRPAIKGNSVQHVQAVPSRVILSRCRTAQTLFPRHVLLHCRVRERPSPW